MGFNLAKQGYTIVSGLAKGIDKFAHIGAICAKGNTIGVIGNGLDIIYPKENELVYQKIIEQNGAIISEYDYGTNPEKINFPARNRIISGLSDVVIVVEARRKKWNFNNSRFCVRTRKRSFCCTSEI